MVKVLLIGLGQIGQGYDYDQASSKFILSHAQAVMVDNRFDLIAGVDPIKMSQERFTAKFNRPAFSKLDDLHNIKCPDLIVIATPSTTHAKMLDDVLRRFTPKAILCEKPLSFDLKQAKAMVENCKKYKIALYINFIRRTDPAILALKSMLATGEVQKPFSGICWYSRGLYNTCLLYTSPSPRDGLLSRMPSSA